MTAPDVLLIVPTPGGRLDAAWPSTAGAGDVSVALSAWCDEVTGAMPEDFADATCMRGLDPVPVDGSARERLAALFGSLDGPAVVRGDPRLVWLLDVLGAVARIRLLVLVEDPVSTLAWQLSAPPGVVVAGLGDAVLRRWTGAAVLLRRHHQRSASRCALIDARDVLTSPDVLAPAASALLGHEVTKVPWPSVTPLEPVSAMLALAAVQADRGLHALQEDLAAACLPVGGESVNRVGLPRPDLDAALLGLRGWGDVDKLNDRLRSLEAQLSAVEVEAHAQRETLKQALAELNVARAERAAAEEATRIAAEAQRAAQRIASTARQQHDLLLLQLEQARANLERHASRRSSAAAHQAQAALNAEVGQIVVQSIRDVPPHRELALTLRQVQIGSRDAGELSVRLVEHHGHPGLVLIETPELKRLLKRWEPNGQEDGTPYALIVPMDEQGRAWCTSLSTSDWHLLTGLARGLGRALAFQPGLGARWLVASRRFERHLAAMPPVLRFDAVGVDAVSERSFDLRLQQVSFADRFWDAVSLRFGMDPSPQLWLLQPSSGPRDLPLADWPVDDATGQAAGSVPLDLARLPRALPNDGSTVWGHSDLEFACACAEALPRALARLGDGKLPAPFGADAVARSLEPGLAKLRTARPGVRVRQALRLLVGRSTVRV